jgi:hypothetical protein
VSLCEAPGLGFILGPLGLLNEDLGFILVWLVMFVSILGAQFAPPSKARTAFRGLCVVFGLLFAVGFAAGCFGAA